MIYTRTAIFIHFDYSKQTRKKFSEKPIEAFMNSTVFILGFYVYYLAYYASCFGLEYQDFEESSYSQLRGSLSPDYKYLHARQIYQQLSFPFQTIPDCIKYIIGVCCYNFNSHTNILALY